MKKYILFTLVLLGTSLSFAQESATTSTLSTETFKTSSSYTLRDRVTLFLSAFPAPIIGGGLGGSLEYNFFGHFAVLYGYERERYSSAGLFSIGGEEKKTTSDNHLAALKYFIIPSKKTGSSLFILVGYKWYDLNVEYNPGLFNGVSAERAYSGSDVFGGIGYSIKRSNFKVDFAINYEPGYTKKITYIPTEDGLLGPTKADLTADVDYGFLPDVRIGYTF